jgi:hypothetical protein
VNVNGRAIEMASTDPRPGRMPKIRPNRVPIRIAVSDGKVNTEPMIEKR